MNEIKGRLRRYKLLQAQRENLLLDVENDKDNYSIKYKEVDKEIKKLDNALNALNSVERECIRLKYIEELRFTDIIDIVNLEVPTVAKKIRNGLSKMKSIL